MQGKRNSADRGRSPDRDSGAHGMVLKHIQLVTGYILRYEAHFRMVMEQQMKLESAEKILTSRKKLNRDEKRIAGLK